MTKITASHRGVIARRITFALSLATIVVGSQSARAQEAMPEGVQGWTYYINSAEPLGLTDDPVSACKKTAANHMGTPLLAMQPSDGMVAFECNYSNRAPWVGAHWYGMSVLRCTPGFTPRWPGVCTKGSEPPPPSSCLPNDPGYGCGNPVQVASGAKVQSETDLVAGPLDTLRIERTYRSLRKTGKAVSAGYGWSFSFDREFSIDRGLLGSALPTVTGTLGDGSYFSFRGRTDGSFASQFDKRLSLQAQSSDYNDWVLTTSTGQVERYRKVNGALLLVSSHSRDGAAQYYSYGADNKLEQISDAYGRSVKIHWSGGEVAAIDGPYGSARYEYDQVAVPGQADIAGMARLIAVHFHDTAGALLASRHYHYEDQWQRFLLTGITDENGKRFATYAYNGVAQAVLSEHAGGANRYAFRYPDQTTRVITDPLGTERTLGVTYASDYRGRITGESQPAGAGSGPASSAFTYSPSGDLTSSTDFNGQKTCFINDPLRGLELSRMSGLPAGASCPASGNDLPIKTGRVISTQWHPDWRLKSGIAEPNRITTYVYNGERGADGQVLHCAGDAALPNGKPIAVLCSKTEQATTDNNGTRGFAAGRTGPLRVWRYTYNSAGQLLTRTGPADASGNIDSIRLTYYADTNADTTDSHTSGDLASITNGAGETTQFLEYGKDGLATKITRPNGQAITLVYGPRQGLAMSTIEDSSGVAESTHYDYDDAGQLIHVVWPDGSAMDYTYDTAHRLTDLRDTVGNTVHLVLDNMGNVIQQEVRGAGGDLVALASRSYDALNRLQKEQRDAQDTGTGYAYDPAGNLTTITDPLGHVSSQAYDSFDRVSAQTLPPPAPGTPAPVIGYTYTNQDQLLSVIDPRKLTTRYGVDGFGQQNAVVSPDTGTDIIAFDAAGNPESRRDANGRTTSYRFDGSRRVTQIGSSTFEYGKDGTGATGRMTKMSDASGQSTYAYDGFGRMLSKTQTVGTGATAKRFSVTYTYGAAGNSVGHVATMIYPSGNRIDIAYGSDGRAASLGVTVPDAGQATIMDNIRYVPFGPVQSWTWGNSTATSPNLYERRFDLDGRITSYPLGHPANNGTLRTLSYDAAGRVNASMHSGQPAAALLDQRYDYDDLDRLVGFDGANSSQRYQYDVSGNRTSATFGAARYLNTISPSSNRLSSTTGPAPAKRNTYDAAGNLISDGTVSYAYGNDGRLSGVVAGGIATGYRYNGLGQRVAKARAAGVAVHYVYDESGRLLGEYDSAGKAIQETVYLDDLPVAVLKQGSASAGVNQSAAGHVYYVYADHLGTPRVITRASDNKMVWRWDHADPFGVDQPDENPGKLGAFAYNPRFPGQMFDKETNNHYNYFRDYDPQTGRYVQSDPIGLGKR
jgi:RHS repeat-associated protein